MKELNVTITMNEEGSFKVETTEGMPIFTAIGMLETAKITLVQGKEADDEEVQDMPDRNEEGE